MAETGDMATGNRTPSYHMVAGEVDVKVLIVAIGCPSEAVSVFCSRRETSRHPWGANSEQTARALLATIRRAFPMEEYKAIPLNAHNCAGLKIHPACDNYSSSRRETNAPTSESMEIFSRVCGVLENLAAKPEALRPSAPRPAHRRPPSDEQLRSEIARIIVSPQQLDAKITGIVRLMEGH